MKALGFNEADEARAVHGRSRARDKHEEHVARKGENEENEEGALCHRELTTWVSRDEGRKLKQQRFLEGAWWRLTEIAASCMLLMSVPWRGGLCPRGSKEMGKTTEAFVGLA